MSKIYFYTEVANRFAFAAQKIANAVQNGWRIVVYCPEANRQALLQKALWSVNEGQSFIPLVDFDATEPAPHVFEGARVCLISDLSKIAYNEESDWLLNLNVSDLPPRFYERFDRILEVVSVQELDKVHARQRWQAYRQANHQIVMKKE